MPGDSDLTPSSIDSTSFVDSASTASSASVGSALVGQALHPRIVTPLAQQVGDLSLSLSLSLSERVPNLLAIARPPMPSDLIAGLDRINNTIV